MELGNVMCWLAEPNSMCPEIHGPQVRGEKFSQSKITGIWPQDLEVEVGWQNPQMSTIVKIQGERWLKLIYLPCLHIRLERSVLVTISWCGSTRATFQQIVRLLMSAITSVIFSTSPQRLRDTSPSLRVTDLAPLLQCHFSVASMHFPHRHSTPKEQFALGRRIYKNKPQTQ